MAKSWASTGGKDRAFVDSVLEAYERRSVCQANTAPRAARKQLAVRAPSLLGCGKRTFYRIRRADVGAPAIVASVMGELHTA